MKALLIRKQETNRYTFGVFSIPEVFSCYTLERPDLNDDGIPNNEKGKSCIPLGTYICKRVHSPHFGETFEVTGVKGRDHILFHAGNTASDSKGCILLGKEQGVLNGEFAVLKSKQAFSEFFKATRDIDEFELIVREG